MPEIVGATELRVCEVAARAARGALVQAAKADGATGLSVCQWVRRCRRQSQ